MREYGLIKLKSSGDLKADIKILSEQLNQSETETLVRSMVDTGKDHCRYAKQHFGPWAAVLPAMWAA